jgi:DNA-binding LytR/AlgR family response regulator
MEKVKILLVEDELIIAEDMKSMLSQKYLVTGIAITYEEAIVCMQMRLPDIVMIDINLLGKKTGIDLAHYINQTYRIPFLFVTSLGDENTLEKAKLTYPYAYLIKPFEKRNLFSAIEIALSNAKAKKTDQPPDNKPVKSVFEGVFFVKKEYYFVKIKSEDIEYVKADGNYLDIISNGEKFIVRSTLKAFADQLSPNSFLQVHKSYIINLNKITAIAYDHVLMNTDEIPLSQAGRNNLLTITNRFS